MEIFREDAVVASVREWTARCGAGLWIRGGVVDCVWVVRVCMTYPMLLLAENHDVEPFKEASVILDDQAAALAVAEERGYVFLKGLLSDEDIAPLRAVVRDFAAERGWVEPDADNPSTVRAIPGAKLTGRGWDDPGWLELQTAVLAHPSFMAIARHPRMIHAVEMLLGEPAQLAFANHCWLKLPGSPEHTTRPHQDISYLPNCPRMWTVWVPLVDTPFEVGPLGVVSGSRHRIDWHHVDKI